MSDLFSYDIMGIHAPVLVGIVTVAIVGFVLMRLAGLRRESGMWIALAILVLVLAWSNERFINLSDPSNAADIIRLTSMLGIYAIGLAFVIITGGIDLSVGSIIGLTGVLIAKVLLPAAAATVGADPQPLAPKPAYGLTVLIGVVLTTTVAAGWFLGTWRRGAYIIVACACFAGACVALDALGVWSAERGLLRALSLFGAMTGEPVASSCLLAACVVTTVIAIRRDDVRLGGVALAAMLGYCLFAALTSAMRIGPDSSATWHHAGLGTTARLVTLLAAVLLAAAGFWRSDKRLLAGALVLAVGYALWTTVSVALAIAPGDAPWHHQWGLAVSVALLAVLCAGWTIGDRRPRRGGAVLLAYAALGAASVLLSVTDAGTGIDPVDAVFSVIASSGGAGAGWTDATVRLIVLAAAAIVGGLAVVRGNRQALGIATGLLLAYHFYALLTLAFGGGQPLWLAIVVALAAATAVGLAQGILLTRLGLQPFIVTLGVMLLIRGVSQTVVRGGTISIKDKALLSLANEGLFYVGEAGREVALLPYPLLIFLAVLIAGAYVLHFTVFGRYVYAIGGNRDAAEYSGLPVRKVEAATYVISAFLGGVAGICYAAYIGQMSQQVGIAYELSAIAACVLGGCSLRGGEGTILGVVIGTAVMRVIENGIIMFQYVYTDENGVRKIWKLDTNWTFIIIGAVILIAIIVDQLVHIMQARRRTRKVAATPTLPKAEPSGFDVGEPNKAAS